jgi:hypothetical protein
MKKKYIVELTEDERFALREVVKKLAGTRQVIGRFRRPSAFYTL